MEKELFSFFQKRNLQLFIWVALLVNILELVNVIKI